MMELDGVPVAVDELATLALVNYGHFTTMRLDENGVRGLDLHLERLVSDCQTVFGARLDAGRARELARRVAARIDPPAILRITVFDPALQLGTTGIEAQPRVLTSVRPAGVELPPPVRLRSVAYQRDLPQVKHSGLFGPLHQRRMARRAGFDDVLFVDPTGSVSEGATWNIGFLVGDEVHWPDAECLPGVTMRLLDDVLRRAGVVTRRVPVRLDDLPAGHGAFITNAGVGIQAVSRIDGRDLPSPAALLDQLRAGYQAIPAQLL